MTDSQSYFVVDDDESLGNLVKKIIQNAGHTVTACHSSVEALDRIIAEKPDVVISDIMMPDMDGFQLCQRIKNHPKLAGIKVIMLTAKAFEYDRIYARKMGADGYLTKPFDPQTLMDDIDAILAVGMTVNYWGVRGTLPVSGEESLRYGGNTSCVTIEAPGKPLLIFDAGTGIKKLADHLMANSKGPITGKIFISHPHWDHVNAFPFFTPLYIPGNEFEVLGARHGDTSVREIISDQMDGIYFPISIRAFGARVYFQDLGEGTIDVDGFTVRTMLLNHPGNCLGYRVELDGVSVCYITDNELFLPDSPMYNEEYLNQLADFCQGADLLITDTTYTDAEYPSKVTWGHSCVSRVAQFAHQAQVKTLHLFHHDPDQNDIAIDGKLEDMRQALNTLGSNVVCAAPAEGSTVKLS